MWAMTEKDLEDKKEDEIDELLEFAYELDYEKYMEDLEVRQALALIKNRVQEIKKDTDWKEKIVKEWNDAAEETGAAQEPQYKRDDDQKSTISYSKHTYKFIVDVQRVQRLVLQK